MAAMTDSWRRWSCAAAVAAFAIAFGERLSTQPKPADLVLLGGKVITADDRFTVASALAIRDGRFVAVGSDADVRPYIASATKVIDARGRSILPGLIDTHVHALDVAAGEARQPYRNLRSIPEMQDWIREAVKRQAAGTWIWTPRVYPTRLASGDFLHVRSWMPPHPIIRSSSTARMRFP
jgi:hypothetical protein